MLNSQVGVVPLDTERCAPVGCLQQVKFQHKRGVQGSLQEGVIAEHRHTHNGGIHHRILGEPARSNRALSSLSLCLAAADLQRLLRCPALTSQKEEFCQSTTRGWETWHRAAPRLGIKPSPLQTDLATARGNRTESSQPLSTGACGCKGEEDVPDAAAIHLVACRQQPPKGAVHDEDDHSESGLRLWQHLLRGGVLHSVVPFTLSQCRHCCGDSWGTQGGGENIHMHTHTHAHTCVSTCCSEDNLQSHQEPLGCSEV